MKRIILAATAASITALALASAALGWHANGVTVTALCDRVTGTYPVTAVIVQNPQYPATLDSVTPTSFAGTSHGGPVVVVVKFTNGEKQTFTKTVTLAGDCTVTPPVSLSCPAGYAPDTASTATQVLCTRTVTHETTREVPGPTVYVDRPVPGPTISTTHVEFVTRWKTSKAKPVTPVIRWRTRTIVKKVAAPIGVCKRPGGGTAVQGSG